MGFGRAADIAEHVAEAGGFFEIHPFGRLFHFLLERGDHGGGLAFEEIAGQADAFEVGGAGNFVDAGGGAIFDDVVEAMTVIGLGGNGGSAGAEVEFFPHEVERAAEGAGVGERPEVACAVVFFQAGELEAGVGIVEVDFDEEEAFVVAEADVVFGPVFLDEAALEKNRFGFGADGVGFEIVDAFEERAGFGVGGEAAGGVEILGDAAVEIAGLADIDDAVEAVLEEIDSRFVGEGADFGGEIRLVHGVVFRKVARLGPG